MAHSRTTAAAEEVAPPTSARARRVAKRRINSGGVPVSWTGVPGPAFGRRHDSAVGQAGQAPPVSCSQQPQALPTSGGKQYFSMSTLPDKIRAQGRHRLYVVRFARVAAPAELRNGIPRRECGFPRDVVNGLAEQVVEQIICLVALELMIGARDCRALEAIKRRTRVIRPAGFDRGRTRVQ